MRRRIRPTIISGRIGRAQGIGYSQVAIHRDPARQAKKGRLTAKAMSLLIEVVIEPNIARDAVRYRGSICCSNAKTDQSALRSLVAELCRRSLLQEIGDIERVVWTMVSIEICFFRRPPVILAPPSDASDRASGSRRLMTCSSDLVDMRMTVGLMTSFTA